MSRKTNRDPDPVGRTHGEVPSTGTAVIRSAADCIKDLLEPETNLVQRPQHRDLLQRGPPTLASPRHSKLLGSRRKAHVGDRKAFRWSLVSFALYTQVIFFRKLSTTSLKLFNHMEPIRRTARLWAASGRTPPDKPARVDPMGADLLALFLREPIQAFQRRRRVSATLHRQDLQAASGHSDRSLTSRRANAASSSSIHPAQCR